MKPRLMQGTRVRLLMLSRCICKVFFTLIGLGVIIVSPPGAMATGALATANDVLGGKFPEGLYADMETDRGTIILQLYYQQVPLTVANFAGLAAGKMDTKVRQGHPFYDGLTFHRVIADFMIQGGDPLGNGTGGPGYQFPDEFDPALKHDGPGVLSMANSGPNTNGSQFFITHKATPWLNFKHTVFGRVVKGQSVVDSIRQGDHIKRISIVPVGEKARSFQFGQAAFDRILGERGKAEKAELAADLAEFKRKMLERFPDAVGLDSGLMYIPLKPGTGKPAEKGSKVSIHFTGELADGKTFVSSKEKGVPLTFTLGSGEVLRAWEIGIPGMKKGEIRRFLVPYSLGYGKAGYPGVIPPKAATFFDIEMMDIQ